MESRVTSGVRWRPSFLLCIVVLAGCGGGGGATRAALVNVTPIPMRTVMTVDFSIQLPKTWRALDRRAALDPTRLKRFERTHPRLRAELRALAGPNSPIKLLAVSPARAAFRANMNVIQTRVPKSVSFDTLAKNEATQIKAVTVVHDLRQSTVELAAARALRLVYRVRQNGVVYQYFVKHESFLYVLTYTSALAAESHFAAVFDASAHAFSLR
jgi:hypothetical protein